MWKKLSFKKKLFEAEYQVSVFGRPSFLQNTTLHSHNSTHTTQHGTTLYGHNSIPHNSTRPWLDTAQINMPQLDTVQLDMPQLDTATTGHGTTRHVKTRHGTIRHAKTLHRQHSRKVEAIIE